MKYITIKYLAMLIVLATTSCQTQQSQGQRMEAGRMLIAEAIKESDVISVRTRGGHIAVYRDVQLGAEQFCGLFLASWTSGNNENWNEIDRFGQPSVVCSVYTGVRSARAKDVRHCEGSDCLWMRGFWN